MEMAAHRHRSPAQPADVLFVSAGVELCFRTSPRAKCPEYLVLQRFGEIGKDGAVVGSIVILFVPSPSGARFDLASRDADVPQRAVIELVKRRDGAAHDPFLNSAANDARERVAKSAPRVNADGLGRGVRNGHAAGHDWLLVFFVVVLL
jgi:hypothetical protein